MQIAVLEGYRVPRRTRRKKGSTMKSAMRSKMKSCAKKHRVATRGFWTCVRGGKRRKSRR